MLELEIARTDVPAREFAAIARHCEQQLCERWPFRAIEMPQALILGDVDHDDGGLAVLRHGLWLTPRRCDDLAEPVLGVLNRPTTASHGRFLLAIFSG